MFVALLLEAHAACVVKKAPRWLLAWFAVFVTALVAPCSAHNKSESGVLGTHDDAVSCVTFSSDGRRLASCSWDKTIKIWDIPTRTCLATLKGHTDRVTSVAFTPDGKMLASGSADKTIRLWDAESGKCVRSLEGHADCVNSLAFSPDGKTLASASDDKTVRLWLMANQTPLKILIGHTDSVYRVLFEPTGGKLASISRNGELKIWNVSDGRNTATFYDAKEPVFCAALSRDGKLLAAGSGDDSLKIRDFVTGRNFFTLEGNTGDAFALVFTADGKTLYSGSSDHTIRIWDVPARKNSGAIKGHSADVYSLALSPDDKILASGSRDKTVKLWDMSAAGLNEREAPQDTMQKRPKKTKFDAAFTAKISRIDMIDDRDVNAIPIEIVPMWLVAADILSIEKAVKPFDEKKSVVLAIHSPSRLFQASADEIPGRKYAFKVFGFTENDTTTYYAATASEIKPTNEENRKLDASGEKTRIAMIEEPIQLLSRDDLPKLVGKRVVCEGIVAETKAHLFITINPAFAVDLSPEMQNVAVGKHAKVVGTLSHELIHSLPRPTPGQPQVQTDRYRETPQQWDRYYLTDAKTIKPQNDETGLKNNNAEGKQIVP